eukprot:10259869-Lingulodinium_polyedra.AAC.1
MSEQLATQEPSNILSAITPWPLVGLPRLPVGAVDLQAPQGTRRPYSCDPWQCFRAWLRPSA